MVGCEKSLKIKEGWFVHDIYLYMYITFTFILVKSHNRVKTILHDIIFVSQSALILGHLITDKTMAAFEILHTMKQKKNIRLLYSFMAMKLDMSKTYDRVE